MFTPVADTGGANQATLGVDYQAHSNIQTVSPGTPAVLSFLTIADGNSEPAETMKLVLSNPTCGARIADNEGIGTIEDPDKSTPRFRVSDAAATEGSSLFFKVTLSGTTVGCAISFGAYNGDPPNGAVSGSDYGPASSRITIAPGAPVNLTVAAKTDGVAEGLETMKLVLSNPGCGGIADGTGIGTIRDP